MRARGLRLRPVGAHLAIATRKCRLPQVGTTSAPRTIKITGHDSGTAWLARLIHYTSPASPAHSDPLCGRLCGRLPAPAPVEVAFNRKPPAPPGEREFGPQAQT